MSFNPDDSTISGSSDASINSPSTNHFLKYDPDSQKWINEQPGIDAVEELQTTLASKLDSSSVGQASGVAAIDADGDVVNAAGDKVVSVDLEPIQTALDLKLDKNNDTVNLADSNNDTFATVNINDDGTPTSSWPDRLAFNFNGVRTGYFNEYGEMRARSAKDSTVAFRAFPRWTAPDNSVFFQLSRTDSTDAIVSVSKKYIDTLDAVKRNDYSVAPSDDYIERTNLNYTVDVESPELHQVRINGVKTTWLNEWGALRGISHHPWGDPLVRAMRRDDDTVTGTNPNMTALEIVDRRTGANNLKMWGRSWVDGSLIRNGNVMADTYVMESGGTPPSNLPAGTVIIELDQ